MLSISFSTLRDGDPCVGHLALICAGSGATRFVRGWFAVTSIQIRMHKTLLYIRVKRVNALDNGLCDTHFRSSRMSPSSALDDGLVYSLVGRCLRIMLWWTITKQKIPNSQIVHSNETGFATAAWCTYIIIRILTVFDTIYCGMLYTRVVQPAACGPHVALEAFYFGLQTI